MRYLTTLALAGVVGLLGACSLLPAKKVPVPPPVVEAPVIEAVKPTPAVRKTPNLSPYSEPPRLARARALAQRKKAKARAQARRGGSAEETPAPDSEVEQNTGREDVQGDQDEG